MDGEAPAAPEIALSPVDRERLVTLLRLRGEALEDEAFELLDQEVGRARVLPPGEIPSDLAVMGARLRYLDRQSGDLRRARLVWPGMEQDDPEAVSVLTPVGCALLGLRCGQTIRWRLRNGATLHLTLVSVLSRPARPWLSELRPRKRRLLRLLPWR